jgi:hypothetical protein
VLLCAFVSGIGLALAVLFRLLQLTAWDAFPRTSWALHPSSLGPRSFLHFLPKMLTSLKQDSLSFLSSPPQPTGKRICLWVFCSWLVTGHVYCPGFLMKSQARVRVCPVPRTGTVRGPGTQVWFQKRGPWAWKDTRGSPDLSLDGHFLGWHPS